MKKKEKLYIVLIVAMIMGIIILFYGVFLNAGDDVTLSLRVMLLGIFLFVVCGIGALILRTPYGKTGEKKNYHEVDFGDFTTLIHNSYEGEWIETSDDSGLPFSNCKIKTFVNSKTAKGADDIIGMKDDGYFKTTTYTTYDFTVFFKIYYIIFNTKEDRKSNHKKMVEIFHDTSNASSYRYFSSDNVQIICYLYNDGKPNESIYRFFNEIDWASSYIKLKY
ncbi:MAG: hypothetical protein IJF83_14785 [Methanobrevibacter sp.]|nr:hypothetical protein [Methanobrevibacter sp.]